MPRFPSLLPAAILMTIFVCLSIPIILAALTNPFYRAQGLVTLGATLGLPTVWYFVFRIWIRNIRQHLPLEDICRELSLEENVARQLAHEYEIQPRYDVGGQLLYRVEDFAEAVTLLRPVDGDVELLRAARGGESVEEVLVRPVRGESD